MWMRLQKIANYVAMVYTRTPKSIRWLYWLLPLLYFLSPIDLFPDFIRRLGFIDDALLLLFFFWALDRSSLFGDFFTQKATQSEQGTTSEGTSTTSESTPPHEILGVTPNATQKEIKKAYRQQLALYHPDKFSHLGPEFEQTARIRTEAIISAYQVLCP